jgi:hypothetical protein
MRIWAGIGAVLSLVFLIAAPDAAPPKAKSNSSSSTNKVDADVLPPGHFVGTIVSAPNSDRMFTLKITAPEVRLKPGAKMPNLSNTHAQNVNSQYRQMMNLQRQMGRSQYHRVSNMMQMQQMYMRMQMYQQQAMARLQQQELRMLQQEINAIQNMYQVVSVSHNVDFQADANVKVRTKDLPDQFDEKGNVKKYTSQELAALKGKDKDLIGYESSVEALQPGQVVQVSLRSHKKSSSATHAPTASRKDKDDDKAAEPATEHKMQATMIVILKDGEALQDSTAPTKQKKK